VNPNPIHPQKTIINPIGQPVEVDEQLADLLEHLWSKGYVTVYSCQSKRLDNLVVPRTRYIMFADICDAERFQAEYGGLIDEMIYHNDRRCVRGFQIPTKEQLSHLN
jgi:hypothetical protein